MNEVERLAIVEVQVEQNAEDIKDLKADNKVIYDIATSVKVMATEMKGMSKQVGEMKTEISEVKNKVVEIENKPARSTAESVSKVKTAVFVAIATFLVTGILGSLIVFAVK